MQPKHIEVICRAVVIHRGKILLCYSKEGGHHFFPGGHVEWGENMAQALRRELKEELGVMPKRATFIGAVENEYAERRGKVHEVNFVFRVTMDKVAPRSREDHISFSLVDEKEFSRKKVLPVVLKRAIKKWLRDRKPFWASSMK